MMHKAIFYLLFTFSLLVACSQQIRQNETSPLYARFTEYRNIEKNNKSEQQFYSPKLWSAITEARSRTAKEQGLSAILLQFPVNMSKITSNKEVHNGNTGCLMVMGIDNKGAQMDYYVSFIHEDGRWVFDEIRMKYFLDGTQRFLKEAVCNEEKQNLLWVEYMQSQH